MKTNVRVLCEKRVLCVCLLSVYLGGEVFTCGPVRNDGMVGSLACRVETFIKTAAEQLHSGDGEYEPEDETDEEHVDDGGDGVDQRIYNDLKMSKEAR